MKNQEEVDHGSFGQWDQSGGPFALDSGDAVQAQGGVSHRRDDSPHRNNVLSCGIGVEALVLAILDGDHALYKVGSRLEERGMLPLLQAGLARESLNDYRLGQILDALFAANLNRVFSAVALNALEVYGIETPWLHQDTTTLSLYGAYAGTEQGHADTNEETAEEPVSPVPRAQPMGIAKMAAPTSSRWCSVWG